MTPILGLLILLAAVGILGFQVVAAHLRNALRVAARGAAEGALAVVEGTLIAWPYAARALGIWIVVLGLSATLVAVGITIHQSWPILIGGLIGWISFVLIFGVIGAIAQAAALAIGAAERVAGWLLTAVSAMLSWFGLVRTVHEGRLELLPERLMLARLAETRRRTYALWWLGIAVVAVFPFWGFAMVLLPTLVGLALFGSFLADWRGYRVEFFWRLLYGLTGLAFVLVIATFLFPRTATAIRTRVVPGADHALWCAIDQTSDECRNEGLRDIALGLHDIAGQAERALRKAAKGRPPPPVVPVLPSGGDESDAPPPEGLPPTAANDT